MKLLLLKFKNLNSLTNECIINFEQLGLQGNSLFLISGPTGSGKTTILDAISLALFKKTPRIDSISENKNELFNIQKKECFSELTFEVQNKIYKVLFTHKKNKKGELGKLTHSLYLIHKDATEELLTNKKREVENKLQDIIKIDFKQFTHATLLAQGSFQSFLFSDINERKALFRNITGVLQFNDIIQFIKELLSASKSETSQIENRISGLKNKLLDETQITNYKNTLLEKQQSKKEIEKNVKLYKNELALKQNFLNLEKDINYIKRKISENEKEFTLLPLNDFNQVKKFRELTSLYEKLENTKKDYDTFTNDLFSLNTKLENLKLNVFAWNHKIKNTLAENEKEQNKNKKLLIDVKDQIKQINKKEYLDKVSLLENLNFQYLTLLDKKEKLTIDLSSFTSKDSDFLTQLVSLKKEITEIDEKLNFFKKEDFSNNLVKLNLLKSNLISLKKEEENYKILKEEIEKNKSLLKEKQNLIEKEHFLDPSIQYLKVHLEKNTPCPVCGSLLHPYVDDIDIKNHSDNLNLQKTPSILEDIQILEKEINKQNTLIEVRKNQIDNFKLQNKNNVLTMKELEDKITNLSENEKESKKLYSKKITIQSSINSLNEFVLLDNEIKEKHIEIYSHFPTLGETFTNFDIENFLLEIKSLTKYLSQEKELLEKEKDLEKNFLSYKDLEKKLEEIQKIYPLILQIKENLNTTFSDENIHYNLDEINISLKEKSIQLEKINSSLNSLKIQKEEENHLFTKKLSEENLSKEIFLTLLEKIKKIDNLEEKILALKEEKIKYQTSFEEKEKIQRENKELETTNFTINELNNLLPKQEESILTFEQDIKELKTILFQNEITVQDFQKEKMLLEEKDENKNNLKELLDILLPRKSSSHLDFESYILSIIFKILLKKANNILMQLNNRYTLTYLENAPLEFFIEDHDLLNNVRSIKNISGGETFIISLALALALTEISDPNNKIDYLFLDEGFGTLDKDNLDNVLDILTSLPSQGKMIGIISHIQALKDRIPDKIEVIPIGEGNSILKSDNKAFISLS